MKAYIDSNIFLYASLYEDTRAINCRELLQKIVNGEMEAITSALTWDEYAHVSERMLGRDVSVCQGEKFLNFPRLTFYPCTLEVLYAAQSLRKVTKLRARDSIHAATAQITKTEVFFSADKDFEHIHGLHFQKVI